MVAGTDESQGGRVHALARHPLGQKRKSLIEIGKIKDRNVKNAPIYLTPQVVRGILGIGHPERIVTLEVIDIPLADACPPSKIYPAGKATSKPKQKTTKKQSKQALDTLAVDRLDAKREPLITAPMSVARQPDLLIHLPQNGSGPALPFARTPDHKFVPKVFVELSAPVTENDTRPFANSREACVRCGIRGDLGCRHQRPYEALGYSD